MKRWPHEHLLKTGLVLFEKIYQKLRLAHHNHAVHYLARETEAWLRSEIKNLQRGVYTPQPIRRYYFKDEIVDSLTIPDRIIQSVLFKILQPTFKYVMNPQCYHQYGPHGVKLATRRIQQALQHDTPRYFIRVDVKSFYQSIPHYLLIKTIKQSYQDPKVHALCENIIRNPIEIRCGISNPDTGIPIRGPLSSLFSALYLKPLDDAMTRRQLTYLRYQDDILILCRTRRQWQRCRQQLLQILAERRLHLARKKSCWGPIEKGFHFLGIDYYSATQTPNNGSAAQQVQEALHNHEQPRSSDAEQLSVADARLRQTVVAPLRWRLHARTYRNAREQVKQRVAIGFSTTQIQRYLRRWATTWWASTRAAGKRVTRASLPVGKCQPVKG